MTPLTPPSRMAGQSVGLTSIAAKVTMITDNGEAHVFDRLGRERVLSVDHTPGGRRPRVGETWVISQTQGYWEFDRVITIVIGESHLQVDLTGASPVNTADGLVPIPGVTPVTVNVSDVCVAISCFLPALQIVADTQSYGLLTIGKDEGMAFTTFTNSTAYIPGAGPGQIANTQGLLMARLDLIGTYLIDFRVAVFGANAVLTYVTPPVITTSLTQIRAKSS